MERELREAKEKWSAVVNTVRQSAAEKTLCALIESTAFDLGDCVGSLIAKLQSNNEYPLVNGATGRALVYHASRAIRYAARTVMPPAKTMLRVSRQYIGSPSYSGD